MLRVSGTQFLHGRAIRTQCLPSCLPAVSKSCSVFAVSPFRIPEAEIQIGKSIRVCQYPFIHGAALHDQPGTEIGKRHIDPVAVHNGCGQAEFRSFCQTDVGKQLVVPLEQVRLRQFYKFPEHSFQHRTFTLRFGCLPCPLDQVPEFIGMQNTFLLIKKAREHSLAGYRL